MYVPLLQDDPAGDLGYKFVMIMPYFQTPQSDLYAPFGFLQ